MRHTFLTRLLLALDRPSIPKHEQLAVYNDVAQHAQPGKRMRNALRESEFRAVLTAAKYAKRGFVANRAKWRTLDTAIYQEYVDVLSTAIALIERAQGTLDSNGQPITLAAFTAFMAERSKKKAVGTVAVCDARWQSWIPAQTRADYIDRLQLHYAQTDSRKGRRFLPFDPKPAMAQAQTNMNRLRASIASVRRVVWTDDKQPMQFDSRANTPFKALWLTAARMAEVAINRMEGDIKTGVIDVVENPVPINWLALLTPEMRARLRDAKQNPAGVSAEGLKSFYAPRLVSRGAPDTPDDEAAILLDTDPEAAAPLHAHAHAHAHAPLTNSEDADAAAPAGAVPDEDEDEAYVPALTLLQNLPPMC